MRVPDALIRNICYPTSYRLPKQNVMVYPPPIPPVKIPMMVHTVHNGRVTIFPDRKVTKENEKVMGNLSNEEYFQFRGYPQAVVANAQCRWCEAWIYTESGRKAHVQQGDCKSHLSRLYNKLRKDRCCVVCDMKTKKATWGVPLCSPKCVVDWRFTLPNGFQFERDLIKNLESKGDA